MADEPVLAPTESDGSQAPSPEPTVPLLSDADLLAWSVVLSHRARQERDGLTILRLPYPSCPSCGEPVDEAEQVTLDRFVTLNVRLTLRPCGHVHETGDEYVRRLWPHIHELLADVTSGYRGHAEAVRSWTTEDIVREARVRVGVVPDEGAPSPATDASARAEQAEATLARVRAEVARIRSITPTWHPVADLIEAALDGTQQPTPRLLACGFCYEEQGQEVHPHPECPIGQPKGRPIGMARIGLMVQPGLIDGIASVDWSSDAIALPASDRVVMPDIAIQGARCLALQDSRKVLAGDEQARITVDGIAYAASAAHPVMVESLGPGVEGGLVTLTLIANRVTIDGEEA